jgi:hypothetical protein
LRDHCQTRTSLAPIHQRPDKRKPRICVALGQTPLGVSLGVRGIRHPRQVTSGRPHLVKQLRREAQDLKEVVAEQALELRLLKKSMIGDGGDQT